MTATRNPSCRDGPGAALRIPDRASAAEAAAIAAAIGAYLREDAPADGATDEGRSWTGRRWRIAGRVAALRGRAIRPTAGTPADPWRAAGRADRLR